MIQGFLVVPVVPVVHQMGPNDPNWESNYLYGVNAQTKKAFF